MAAASACQFYANNIDLEKLSDLSANIFMVLCTSSYVPDTTNTGHTVYANLTNELTTSGGYTSGGVALSSPTTATYLTTGFKWSTGNASWTASGGGIPAWRYGVIYYSGSLWGITSPLLCYFTGDSAPADIAATSSGNVLQVTCPANGWFTVTRT